MSAHKRSVDWEKIEAQYRAGTLSVREIAGEHRISHTAIQKRAKEFGWSRDLSAKIKAKADAKVAKALVAREVATATGNVTETQVVEVEAEVQARIRLAHRQDIARNRALAMKLVGELEQVTDEQGLVEQMRDALMAETQGASGKSRVWEVWQRLASLPGRADTMKKLAETVRILVTLEREAFGIASSQGGGTDGLPLVVSRDLTGRR